MHALPLSHRALSVPMGPIISSKRILLYNHYIPDITCYTIPDICNLTLLNCIYLPSGNRQNRHLRCWINITDYER